MKYKISLKAARINANLTQKDVAKAIGMTIETISNYELGLTVPDYDTVVSLCELYNVPQDLIFFKSKSAKSERW